MPCLPPPPPPRRHYIDRCITIAKNAILITKYAHMTLSLMMSPPVYRSQNEKKFAKTKPQRTLKPKLTFSQYKV